MATLSQLTVPGIGPKTCKICIVGEAPGETEIEQGKPFVGKSGQLLDRMLHTVGILRSNCYTTNVVKERPPNNDISHFIEFYNGRVKTETPEYKRYEQELYEELKEIDANVYIALGGTAIYALTRKISAEKYRGSLIQSSCTGATRKVLCTVHPSYCLRVYLAQFTLLADLRRALAESESPSYNPLERNIQVRPTHLDASQYLEDCSRLTRVGFDIEIINEEVSCFSFAKSKQDVMSIPLVDKNGDYFDPEQELEIWKQTAAILENECIEKVGQNIIFDAGFLLRKQHIRTKNMHDTMIGQAILYPEFPKGLDFITSLYTKEPYYKDDGKKWNDFFGDEEAFWIYNAKDSAVCLEAFEQIHADLAKMGNVGTYDRQRALLLPAMYMQEHGTLMDVVPMKERGTEIGIELEALRARFSELVGSTELNPASPKQMAAYFYGTKGIKPYVNRKTGKLSTDEDALKRIAIQGHQEARVLMDIRELAKLKGTYYDMRLDPDSRLRCAINPVGTKFGRTSSSENIFGTGTNMQNIPRNFRRYMLADPGCVAYDIDLDQAENRVVAYISPDATMIQAFETDTDIHTLTASNIFKKPVEEISTDEDVDTGRKPPCPFGNGRQSERFWGKKANHSFNYDFGYRAFSVLYEMKERDGRYIWEAYRELYTGVPQYHRWVQDALNKDRSLTNLFGRKVRLFDRWGDELFKQAYSFIPQSTVADIMNSRGVCFIYERQDLFEQVQLLNVVHDSVVIQIPISAGWDYHESVLRAIKGNLEVNLTWRGQEFSIPASVKHGRNLYDMKKIKFNKSIAEQLEETYGIAG